MTYEEWQRKRGVWMEEEKLERQSNFVAARTHIQVAITERAVRELFDRVAVLETNTPVGPAKLAKQGAAALLDQVNRASEDKGK